MKASCLTARCNSRPLRVSCSAENVKVHSAAHHAVAATTRRSLLAGAAAVAAPMLLASAALAEQSPSIAASASGIEILIDEPGTGTATARTGDLVMLHIVGKVASDGSLFDSTRGGQMYLDGGKGTLRPTIIQLGGAPVPGICAGLQQGIQGMRIGGSRTFTVPPAQGFGSSMVRGPYGAVPGNSTLQYEVQLLRLSRRGPEELMTGVSQCGGGAVMERTAGCSQIEFAEFL